MLASFHIDCLQGSNICKVCIAFLKRQIRKLTDTATQAIFNPATCEDDHNDDNENENNENVDIRQVSDADINNGIQNRIESLARITPPSPTTASSSSISLTSNKKKTRKLHTVKHAVIPFKGISIQKIHFQSVHTAQVAYAVKRVKLISVLALIIQIKYLL